MNKFLFLLDAADGVNFYTYMFIRKMNLAMGSCGINYTLQPHRLYCALSITSPRTRRLYAPDEKEMFLAA